MKPEKIISLESDILSMKLYTSSIELNEAPRDLLKSIKIPSKLSNCPIKVNNNKWSYWKHFSNQLMWDSLFCENPSQQKVYIEGL